MIGGGGRFDPSELRDLDAEPAEPRATDAELADALAIARELDALAAGEPVRPSDGFDDRVMAAIALEPAPRLVVRRASAGRGGPIGAFLVTFGDAWRVATTGGRPAAIRAQALAFVLLVLLAGAALTTVGAVGVGAFLRGNGQANPSLRPAPTVGPTNVDTTQPSESLEASDSPEPSESPEATGTAEAPEATATPKSGETAKPASTIRPTRTPRPTETPHVEDTQKPGQTPRPTGTDDHGGGGGGGGPGPG